MRIWEFWKHRRNELFRRVGYQSWDVGSFNSLLFGFWEAYFVRFEKRVLENERAGRQCREWWHEAVEFFFQPRFRRLIQLFSKYGGLSAVFNLVVPSYRY